MKLLIVTQVIDQEHPILGFFHRWVEEFAVQCESVVVICQAEGSHGLPENVQVLSLGKEASASKISQLFSFYTYCWRQRDNYDAVFVHMVPLYVALGGPLWRVLRKRINLWYTHGSVSVTLRVAEMITHKILTASKDSCTLKSSKINVTGHGIDTDHFRPMVEAQKDIDLITVGRISKAKNLTALIDILARVRTHHDVSLSIVGKAVTKSEKAYEADLRRYITAADLNAQVHFVGAVSQDTLPLILNRAQVFVTTAQNGSLDKAMLEAMACGLSVVSMAPGSMSLPLGANQVKDSKMFVAQLKKMIESKRQDVLTNAQFVQGHHSLNLLIAKIIKPSA